jgi:hypothetical protein
MYFIEKTVSRMVVRVACSTITTYPMNSRRSEENKMPTIDISIAITITWR